MKTAYLAPQDYLEPLLKEIFPPFEQYDRLLVTPEPQQLFWVQNTWHNPFVAHFETISEAAKILKNIQRNWALYPYSDHRRAALIQEKLPYVSHKTIQFPGPKPTAPLGSWTLLDKITLLASPHCSSPYRNGEITWRNATKAPPAVPTSNSGKPSSPSGKMPKAGDKCLEIGSSPGGWTWVLANLHAQVLSVDRSPLAPHIAAMNGVMHKTGNAFAQTPDLIGPVDWIFSDVACYPEKLLEWTHLVAKPTLQKFRLYAQISRRH